MKLNSWRKSAREMCKMKFMLHVGWHQKMDQEKYECTMQKQDKRMLKPHAAEFKCRDDIWLIVFFYKNILLPSFVSVNSWF